MGILSHLQYYCKAVAWCCDDSATLKFDPRKSIIRLQKLSLLTVCGVTIRGTRGGFIENLVIDTTLFRLLSSVFHVVAARRLGYCATDFQYTYCILGRT